MMNYDELLDLLDMEGPTDFVYFEQFAELLETGEDITQEAILELVKGADNEILAELTEGYFEDILQFIPDDEMELFTLLQTIGTTLSSLAQGEGVAEEGTRAYAEELFKFRNWYTTDSRVLSTDREEGSQSEIPLIEALTNYRVRNFVEDEYDYDFSEALDYPLDEYIVSLVALADDDAHDDDVDDDDVGYDPEDDFEEDPDSE